MVGEQQHGALEEQRMPEIERVREAEREEPIPEERIVRVGRWHADARRRQLESQRCPRSRWGQRAGEDAEERAQARASGSMQRFSRNCLEHLEEGGGLALARENAEVHGLLGGSVVETENVGILPRAERVRQAKPPLSDPGGVCEERREPRPRDRAVRKPAHCVSVEETERIDQLREHHFLRFLPRWCECVCVNVNACLCDFCVRASSSTPSVSLSGLDSRHSTVT